MLTDTQGVGRCSFWQSPGTGWGRDAPTLPWWPQASPVPGYQTPRVGWSLLQGGQSSTELRIQQGRASITWNPGSHRPSRQSLASKLWRKTRGWRRGPQRPSSWPGAHLWHSKSHPYALPSIKIPLQGLQRPPVPQPRRPCRATQPSHRYESRPVASRAGIARTTDVLRVGELSCSACCRLEHLGISPTIARPRVCSHDSFTAKLAPGQVTSEEPNGSSLG